MKLSKIALMMDLSDMDKIVLNYIKKINENYKFDQITLIHFIEVENFPDEVLKLYPDLDEPIESIIGDELKEYAQEFFGQEDVKTDVHVHKKGGIENLLEWIDRENYDLVAMGKKPNHYGSGTFSSKVARLSNNNTLFVSEIARGEINKIMVPVDFSSYTNNALKIAKESADLLGAELIPVHAIKVGMQYFPFIKDKKEIMKELEKSAAKKYKKIKSKLKLKEDCVIIEDIDQHISKTIYDRAVFESVDLIVLGNKGKADDSEFLIGSVAERMIAPDKNLPVLIVKN
ncbi:universal stress protein [Marinilabiliaceae bacterium ANBcel2]|nr:universal stress protein [Marinilabiliaceae bacterium ANBcel2]